MAAMHSRSTEDQAEVNQQLHCDPTRCPDIHWTIRLDDVLREAPLFDAL